MGISIVQYRIAVGLFHRVKFVKHKLSLTLSITSNTARLLYVLQLFICGLLLLRAGDIELNPGPKKLTICQLNVRSLKDKLPAIRTSLAGSYDIIAITETHLSESSNFDLNIQGYQPFIHLDRPDRGGGGIGVYICNDLAIKRINNLEIPSLEAMWLDVRSSNNKFLLCVCYRPPDLPVSFWDDFQTQLDLAKQIHNNILITGDLNADPNSTNGPYLDRFANQNHLQILVQEPTRITEHSATILDQFLSNMIPYISEVTVIAPVSTNDHCTITLTLAFHVCKEKCYARRIWYYNRADFSTFRDELNNFNWELCFQSDNIDEVCSLWTNNFLDIANRCIPNKNVTIRPDDLPWYNSNLRKLKRKKDRLHNMAKRSNSPQSWHLFREARNKYISELREAEETYNNKLVSELKDGKSLNPKHWWRLCKNFLGKNNDSLIPPIMEDNCVHFTNDNKAEAFNNFFLSHSSINTDQTHLPPQEIYTNASLTNLSVTEEDILDILKSLDTTKSSGPDGISPRMLKEASTVIYKPLTKLINLSLSTCRVPEAWKRANVLPLHKKNEKNNMNNYRPISLLSCVSKVLERAIFKYVFNYFRDNFLISIFQSGFVPGDSTVNQLVQLYHTMCEAVDQKKELRIVFCDISKAFDKVWHKGIIYKLRAMGISGKLLKWFESYLQDRHQRVVISGSCSSWGHIQAGVPQGSVLGPLLFLVYINDITRAVNSQIRLFADDTCLFITVDDPIVAADNLNSDLETISSWADRWLVTFSAPKTESLLVSLKHDSDQHPTLKLNNTDITEVENHKHLGLTFSSNLTWDKHVDEILMKAGSRIDVLSRLMYKLDRRTLEIMYTAFVRPKMEYADIVWSNLSQQKCHQLECLQKRAGRIVSGAIRGSSTAEIYQELGWDSLEERRNQHKLLFLHKIIHGNTPQYLSELLPSQVGEVSRYPLRNDNDYVTFQTRTGIFYRSFFPSTVREWNLLDPNIRNIEDYSEFKRQLLLASPRPNPLYYNGNRRISIIHARIRMKCSLLNAHLADRHIIADASCNCGHTREDSIHYFFVCNQYDLPRALLHREILKYSTFNLHTVLYGDSDLSYVDNKIIFEAVHTYIEQTQRFT